MPKQSISTLKNWFKRGLKPLETQFADWLDSFWHKDSSIPMNSIQDLQTTLNSFATTANLATKEDKSAKGVANGYASLDGTGKVPSAQIPETHFRGKYVSLVALQTAVPVGGDGDYAVVDTGSGADAKQYIWDANEGWVLSSGSGGVSSFNGRNGVVTSQPGDYTAAQVTNAESTLNKGVANGYASLDEDGKVPAAQLPEMSGGGGLSTRKAVFRFNSDLYTEHEMSFRGIITSLTQGLTARITSVTYEARTDAGSYASLADLTALQAWINSNISGTEASGTKFWIKCLATYTSGQTGVAENVFTYTPS